jgi:hypothetical protein
VTSVRPSAHSTIVVGAERGTKPSTRRAFFGGQRKPAADEPRQPLSCGKNGTKPHHKVRQSAVGHSRASASKLRSQRVCDIAHPHEVACRNKSLPRYLTRGHRAHVEVGKVAYIHHPETELRHEGWASFRAVRSAASCLERRGTWPASPRKIVSKSAATSNSKRHFVPPDRALGRGAFPQVGADAVAQALPARSRRRASMPRAGRAWISADTKCASEA